MATQLNEKDLIEHFDILLTVAARPEMVAELNNFAYDENARQADGNLLAQVRTAKANQQKEEAEARTATQTEDKIQATARTAFTQLHRLITIADRTTPNLDFKHILNTQRLPQAENAFLNYTTNLLDRLKGQADIMTALGRFGFTADRITELSNLIQSVREADKTQQQELSEAKQATAIYQDLITQLRLSYSILTTLTKEAAKNNPTLKSLLP